MESLTKNIIVSCRIDELEKSKLQTICKEMKCNRSVFLRRAIQCAFEIYEIIIKQNEESTEEYEQTRGYLDLQLSHPQKLNSRV